MADHRLLGRRILVVEDSPIQAMEICDSLSAAGLQKPFGEDELIETVRQFNEPVDNEATDGAALLIQARDNPPGIQP